MEIKDTGTAAAGSEPAKAQSSDSPTDTSAATGSQPAEEKVPFDQDPRWKSARLAEKKLNEALAANGVENFEELLALAESGKKVAGKLTDPDQIETLMEKAARLDSYERYWELEAERQRRESEAPDETVSRLEQENARLKQERMAREQAQEADKALKAYSSEVGAHVKATLPDVSDEDYKFITEFFGVNNPFADIDITDKMAIRRMVTSGVKKLEAFKQRVIKGYLEGKEKIPDTTMEQGGTVPAPRGIKNLKEAKAAMMAAFSGK